MGPNYILGFHTCLKKTTKKASKKHSKMIPKTVEIESPNDSKTKILKKQLLKSTKLAKMIQNMPKWGPQKMSLEVPFSSFLSIGAPLGTHMAPRASKRGPRKPPSFHFASCWHPFSHIFATIYTFCSHICAANFLHFLK